MRAIALMVVVLATASSGEATPDAEKWPVVYKAKEGN